MIEQLPTKENANAFSFSKIYALMLCLYLMSVSITNAQNYLPRSYWTFDNTSNPLKDSMSLFNLDPNYYSSQYTINTNPANAGVGKYMTYNAATGYVRGGQLPTDSAFTIEFLFRPGYQFNTAKLFYRQDGAFTGRISYPDIQFATTIKDAGGNYQTDDFHIELNQVGRKSYGYYMDGNWHHFVFKYNSHTGVKEVWVDGQLPAGFSKVTTTGTFNNTTSTNKDLMIDTYNYYEQIYGDYDEFAIYSYGLPANMIYKHYTNFQSHQHYSFSYTSTPPPAPASVTAGIDLTEFPPGHPNVTVSAIDQLKTFPAPRYKAGHTLLPNFNLMDPMYFGSRFQPGVTDAQADANSVIIQSELARNFNYMLNIGWSGTGFNSWVTLANANPQWKVALMTLRPQINGGNTKIWYQGFANDHYVQNSSGQFLDLNGNVTSNKIWRPTAPIADYVSDGQAANSLLSTALSGLTRNVDLVTENGEVFPFLTNTALAADPVVTAAKNSSGLDWENFLAKKIKENETQAYRDQFMSLPRLANAKFTEYRLDGHREYQFRWEQMKYVNTPINGQYYSTADFYVRWPKNWRTWISAWHGWQWIADCRYNELAGGDKLYSPYIAAGWDINPENDVRPAQWLGLLKCLNMSGAEFFYTGYFNEQASYMPPNPPPYSPKGYAWQAVMPSYAQAVASRYEDLMRNGSLMSGDVWNDNVNRTFMAFSFQTGDLRKLVVIRKHNSTNKYAITGTIQPNSGMMGNAENESVATITLSGQTLKFKVRRQGSTYIYDNTVPSAPVFYQVDGWHESIYPYNWTKDFNLEAELFDNVNTNVVIKTKVPAGTASGDFTQATSCVGFNASTNVDYNFLPRGLTTQNYYLWVRARSKSGISTGFTVLMDGTNSKVFDCIKDTNWVWYRFTTSNQVVSYTSLSLASHQLRITATNTYLEIDKIALTTNSTALYGTAPNPCSNTATITPNGSTTFCQGGSVTLTASSGTNYQWSTGAVTQAINVSTSGNYTVTVTSASGTAVASPVTVTVNSLPTATITAGGPLTFCQGGSVTLTSSSGSSYLWSPGNQTTQAITVTAAGSYTVRVTSSAGCTKISNATVVAVNSLPTATITPNGPLIFNQGGSVTLTASSGSSYLWSPGNQTTQSIVVTTSGTYTVRVTNSNGCSAISLPVVVTVNGGTQGVAVITPNGPTSFCQGGNVVLSANAGISYIWSTGQTTQSITVTTSGSYVVTVTFTSNTSTSSPVAVTVTNCSCPVPVGLYESSVAATSATLKWTAVTGVDFLQVRIYEPVSQSTYFTNPFSGTFTQISVGAAPNTKYRWRIRSMCNSVYTAWSNVDYYETPPLRLGNTHTGNTDLMDLYLSKAESPELEEAIESISDMNIFPNPATVSATVNYFTDHEGTILLQLMDFTGKIMRTENHALSAGNNIYGLDLKNLAKGVYMVIITDNDQVNTRKIVVN
ncbi:MAG TPA: T9SS type A sorting domain-containing protein [Bacteroidia bacterium]|nr:T9SS type A sorting domain-containing protein [Bacteroidia bacterium]